MIKHLKYLPLYLREVFFNMKHNFLMTMASISTVMILSIILGFFMMMVMNINYWSANVVRTLHIAVYIKDDLTDEQQISELQNRIAVLSEVEHVAYISKEDALLRMRKRLGKKLALSELGANPFPNSFEVKLKDPEKIPLVASKIEKFSGVEEVKYGDNITGKLFSLNRAVRATGMIVVLSLIAATLFIVSNTIRITVYARRREISIMQMVGASNWFIRWPFVIEGIIYGLFGALTAALVLTLAYNKFIFQFNLAIPFIVMVKPSFLLPRVLSMTIFTGLAVGIAGSWFSVNKYLKNFVSRP